MLVTNSCLFEQANACVILHVIFRYRSGTVQFLLLLPMYIKQRYSIISDEVVNTGCSY